MADTRTYSPGGKGHRMLARAEEGAASTADLYHAAAPTGSAGRRKRMRFVLLALVQDGLVEKAAPEAWEITDAGLAALRRLRRGDEVMIELTWKQAA